MAAELTPTLLGALLHRFRNPEPAPPGDPGGAVLFRAPAPGQSAPEAPPPPPDSDHPVLDAFVAFAEGELARNPPIAFAHADEGAAVLLRDRTQLLFARGEDLNNPDRGVVPVTFLNRGGPMPNHGPTYGVAARPGR